MSDLAPPGAPTVDSTTTTSKPAEPNAQTTTTTSSSAPTTAAAHAAYYQYQQQSGAAYEEYYKQMLQQQQQYYYASSGAVNPYYYPYTPSATSSKSDSSSKTAKTETKEPKKEEKAVKKDEKHEKPRHIPSAQSKSAQKKEKETKGSKPVPKVQIQIGKKRDSEALEEGEVDEEGQLNEDTEAKKQRTEAAEEGEIVTEETSPQFEGPQMPSDEAVESPPVVFDMNMESPMESEATPLILTSALAPVTIPPPPFIPTSAPVTSPPSSAQTPTESLSRIQSNLSKLATQQLGNVLGRCVANKIEADRIKAAVGALGSEARRGSSDTLVRRVEGLETEVSSHVLSLADLSQTVTSLDESLRKILTELEVTVNMPASALKAEPSESVTQQSLQGLLEQERSRQMEATSALLGPIRDQLHYVLGSLTEINSKVTEIENATKK